MLVAKLGMTMNNICEREKENVREKEKGRKEDEREEGERQSVRREERTNFREENREYKLKEHRSVRRNDNALGLPHTNRFIFSSFSSLFIVTVIGSLSVKFSASSRAYFIFALIIVSINWCDYGYRATNTIPSKMIKFTKKKKSNFYLHYDVIYKRGSRTFMLGLNIRDEHTILCWFILRICKRLYCVSIVGGVV